MGEEKNSISPARNKKGENTPGPHNPETIFRCFTTFFELFSENFRIFYFFEFLADFPSCSMFFFVNVVFFLCVCIFLVEFS